jgi:hypothetical protein
MADADRRRAFGAAAAEGILRYDVDTIAGRWEGLFDELAASTASRSSLPLRPRAHAARGMAAAAREAADNGPRPAPRGGRRAAGAARCASNAGSSCSSVPMRRLVLLLIPLLVAAARPRLPRALPTARCIGAGSPTCFVWKGKVTYVADGDTVYVDVDGDGTARPSAFASRASTRWSRRCTPAARRCGAASATRWRRRPGSSRFCAPRATASGCWRRIPPAAPGSDCGGRSR